MRELVRIWQKRQVLYEEWSEKYKESNPIASQKYKYKAVATRDCWKELLSIIDKK